MKIQQSVTKLVIPLLGLGLGVWMIVLGAQMAQASFEVQNRDTIEVPGDKGKRAAIGGAGGALVGGGAAAAVGGGIGIVLMGTGIGIPFGALILIGTGLGAGAGALAGAATGKSPTTETIISTTTGALYSPWQWGAVLAAGIVIVIISVIRMRGMARTSMPAQDWFANNSVLRTRYRAPETLDVLSQKNMKCQCQSLADVFYIEDAPEGFEKNLIKKETGNWVWLGACPQCSNLWKIDAWDKYQQQFVERVQDEDNWERQDTTEQRKQLLLKSRGGLTEEECIWAGCHQKRVEGVAYCLDHLWDTGARK
jgi:hypothetical protein